MDFRQARYTWAVVVGCIALPCCRKSMDMSNPASANSTVTATAPAAGTTTPISSQDALPAGFTATAFAPGRYVSVIGRLLHGTHALQVLNEDSTALLAIELSADGSATVTRGWRYSSRNDGPQVHTQENYREQQGYRGTFITHDVAADVVFKTDDTVCPHIFEGAYALDRAAQLALRCIRAVPPAALGVGTAPVLLCRSVPVGQLEFEPQIVESVAEGPWLVLGGGNGLQVQVTGRPLAARAGEPMHAIVSVASAPIASDAWQRRLASP